MRARLIHNSKKRRRIQIVFFSLLFILIAILLPKITSTITSAFFYPVHVTSVWINESSSLIPTFVRSRVALEEQIESLENKLVIAQNTSLTQQRLLEENNHLRSLLGADGEDRIAASVIARPNELPYDFLQIDRGSKHGVEVGAPVFVGKDVVIGLVVHVAEEYSFVEMITTSGFKASAFISGPDVAVTMEGMGGGVARVRVPQGVPLMGGNLVYLLSVEPGVFGRISYIENRPTQPEQYGYITPDISMLGLHSVSVGHLSQISRSTSEIDERILKYMSTQLMVYDISMGLPTTTEAVSTSSEIWE